MSISITISPEAAVQAGARWRILGHGEENVWLGSGDVASGLEPRHYQIAFAPAMGWREPQSLRVRNVHGFTNGKTAAYTPLSFYELGQIPRQTVWHGQWLQFMIPAGESGAIKISCDSTPEGELSMDPGTGLFRYKPGAGDRFPFSVTLTSEDGGKAQTFEITPMPILLPRVYKPPHRPPWLPMRSLRPLPSRSPWKCRSYPPLFLRSSLLLSKR